MAKISISRVLERRKWTKIGSVFAALVLGFFVVQLLIIKNPWGARAAWIKVGTTCTLDSGTQTLPSDDTSCDGKDVVISGPTSVLTVEGTHTFKSVRTTDGGQLISAASATITTSGASIKKTLYPYKRAGAPVVNDGSGCVKSDLTNNPEQVNCFNPYALQLNDIIKVKIDVYNHPGPASWLLVDEYLRVPGGSYKCSVKGLYDINVNPTCPNGNSCLLNDGSGETAYGLHGNTASAPDSGGISWSLSFGGNVYYYCKVQ